MNAYEIQRLENIKQNQKILTDLNIRRLTESKNGASKRDSRPPPAKRQKIENTPSRTSARIASTTRPSYNEDVKERYSVVERTKSAKRTNNAGRRGKHGTQEEEEEQDAGLVPTKDAETIRAGWSQWESVAPPPTRDEYGTIHFEGFPAFTPNKSPEEIIREGCFGGSYYRSLKSRKLGITVVGDWEELPEDWIDGLDVERYLTSTRYDPDVNKYKVACGQSIEEWEAAGWIAHEYDVRGWFQWYTRFYRGRRCDDDERQVGRWRKCVGETGRWRRMLLKKYMATGVREVFDDGEEEGTEVSPVMHQTCHHWAWEVRQGDLDEVWRGGR